MGDGTEPLPRLTAAREKDLAVQIMQCTTRAGLDKLTRLVWRTYSAPISGMNDAALGRLKARIEAQRAVIARNDPR